MTTEQQVKAICNAVRELEKVYKDSRGELAQAVMIADTALFDILALLQEKEAV